MGLEIVHISSKIRFEKKFNTFSCPSRMSVYERERCSTLLSKFRIGQVFTNSLVVCGSPRYQKIREFEKLTTECFTYVVLYRLLFLVICAGKEFALRIDLTSMQSMLPRYATLIKSFRKFKMLPSREPVPFIFFFFLSFLFYNEIPTKMAQK